MNASTSADIPSPGLNVLHIAECYEAGVGHALDTIARIRRQDTLTLLYAGSRQPSPDFENARALRKGFLARILHVRAMVKEFKPDVVHLHSSWAGVYGRLAMLDTPVVYQPHCFKFDDPALPWVKAILFRRAEKALGGLSKVVLALSSHEANLAKDVSPSAQCVMVPNAPTVPKSPRSRTTAIPREPKIVMVGRLSPQKDPTFFANIASLVRVSNPKAKFIWVGDGEKDLKNKLTDADIEVTGWLSSSELVDLLDSASCYVHSASYEGFPLSVLDAAARGLPMVVRKIPAFEDTGLLQGSTPDEVADLVSRMIGNSQYAQETAARSSKLLGEMNETRQMNALESAYKFAVGSTL